MAFKWWPVDKGYFIQTRLSNWRHKSAIRDFIKEVSNPVDQVPPVISKIRMMYLIPPELPADTRCTTEYFTYESMIFVNGVAYDNTINFDGFSGYTYNGLKADAVTNGPNDAHLCYVASEQSGITSGVDYNHLGVFNSSIGKYFTLGGVQV